MMTLRPSATARLLAAGTAAALLAGCGSDGGTPAPTAGTGSAAAATRTAATGPARTSAANQGGTSDEKACDVTDPATVTAVFGGTSAPEKAGQARNCEYTLTGGRVSLVEVYALGSSDAWDAQKKQAADIGGPLTPVQVGDDAYSLKTPPNTIYVKDGDRIIGVQVVDIRSQRSYLPDLTKLARSIVG